MSRTPIAIFASGRGSGFESIARAVKENRLSAEIVALVCDKPGAPVLDKARAAGIRTLLIEPSAAKGGDPGERRRAHDQAVVDALSPLGARFAVMAGYMRVVTPVLLGAFSSPRGYSRAVNVHPSLLPAFVGTGGYAQAFEYGAKVAGVTVHLVNEELDCGPICAQESFDISDCRSAEEVEKRGLAVEHRLYPAALSWILPEKFEVEKKQGWLSVRPN